ncbi:GM13095 [Drosophila sechellia]|uniref:GM13095 n=1 Tax=Drosophila sechellia TaxID=7238 RepID=B4IK35_DROSE|nr:GM13095 [Drosophila sechellia]
MEGAKLSAVRIAVREAPYRQFLGRREPSVVQFPPWSDGKSLMVEQNEFHFDHAFPATISQDEMYQALILPLVDKLLEGFQCTALAYGQTGTGKSYSMGMTPPDKQSLAARTTHVLRQALCTSTAIKPNAANHNSLVVPSSKYSTTKPLSGVLHRTRSELGMTPKAKKRSRLGCFENLFQVKSLPIWSGNKWERFCQINCLDT